MFAYAKTLLVVATCALVAHAQSNGTSTTATAPGTAPSAPPGLDTCIVGCLTSAAAAGGCSSFTDTTCVCNSNAFKSSALSCLEANCTQADLQTVEQLSQQCAAVGSGNSTTASGSSSAMSGASSTSPGATTTPTAAGAPPAGATTSSAAMSLSAPLSLGGFVGTFFASAGALVGAAFVL